MQLWKTIVVIALLLVVGGYALYLGHQPAPNAIPKLFTLEAKDIHAIELHSPARDLVIERGKGDDWNIVKPIHADADSVAAQAIAEAIASLDITSTVEEKPSDLAPFGLANPAVVVTVTSRDKRVLPGIMVGKGTPVGNSAYIKTTDKPAIMLVSNGFPAQVNKTVDDLRSRVLIGFKPDDIRKLVLHRGSGSTLELERDGDKWNIVKPTRYLADKTGVQQLLDGITTARVSDFIDDNPTDLGKYGLAEPSLKVELYGKSGNAGQSLLFGYKQPEADKSAIYARRGEGSDEPVCSVPNSVFTTMDKSFDDLRDKTVLRFDQSDVQRVVLTGGPFVETVERAAGGKWTVSSEGKTAPAEVPVAESLLDQLHDLKATKIVEDQISDPNRYGMTKPTLTAALYGKDGKEIGTIRLSSLEATFTPKTGNAPAVKNYYGYATTTVSPVVYDIPPSAVSDLENTTSRLHADVTGTPTPASRETTAPTPSAGVPPHPPS
jgi:uncharacterized protein DUF4340